jgi:hypothetical protein
MALDWKSVRSEHVRQACELVASGKCRVRGKAKSLFVSYEGQVLPAKHVMRLAFLVAKGLPLESDVRFASGESTAKFLRELGFVVTRSERDSNSDSVRHHRGVGR